MKPSFRRIVTGHDDEGTAVILSDAPPPRVQRIGVETGPMFYEVWNTRETPVKIDRRSGEPAETGLVLAPPKRGTRIRVLDIPPESAALRELDASGAKTIAVMPIPDRGLGEAINDRLQRAACSAPPSRASGRS